MRRIPLVRVALTGSVRDDPIVAETAYSPLPMRETRSTPIYRITRAVRSGAGTMRLGFLSEGRFAPGLFVQAV